MNRREMTQSLISTVASYSLLQSLFQQDAFAESIKPAANSWLRRLQEMSQDLRANAITPGQWQYQIDELFNRVTLEELLTRLDFDRLTAAFELPDLGVTTRDVRFPPLQGLPVRLAFHGKVFGMKKARAIIPHGHRNMVSCHYVLKGAFHLRHYDRLEDDATHMVIEPTVDQLVRPGSHSAISDEKNNVHWLIAESDEAFTYDVLIADLDGKKYEIDNIDPDTAEKVAGDRVRVRKLPVEEALRKYGRDVHHHPDPGLRRDG